MQGTEKTRENQFVEPNTVTVASTILMNFSLSDAHLIFTSKTIAAFRRIRDSIVNLHDREEHMERGYVSKSFFDFVYKNIVWRVSC